MINDKIKTRDQIAKVCREYREQGKIIGFTSGAFDLIHAGHVDYLEKAKNLCDILIVALNTDNSIKKYKGNDRPIITEELRAKVVAALEFVDHVFLFNERRNEKNIEILKPNIYFKAGDYKPEQLTSKSVIEKIGGRIKLIPIKHHISTTDILSKSSKQTKYIENENGVAYFERKIIKSSPAIFLDRDGTINEDTGYVSDPENFVFLPNAIEGLRMMYNMCYRLVIVTNQGGIGLGYYTKEDFYRVNKRMMREISAVGIRIDKIYFCPHSLAEECDCRKPKTKLVDRAKKDLNIDMANSYFIGDRESDIETGKNAELKTILINYNQFDQEKIENLNPDFVALDLLDAANFILNEERKS